MATVREARAEQLYLRGNQLPQRWHGRTDFVVLDTGFELGHNLLATWAAWRADPAAPSRLWYIALAERLPSAADWAQAHQHSRFASLAAELNTQWPLQTPDFHSVDLDGGRVRLLLAFAGMAQALPELVATVDAFYLDVPRPGRTPAAWDAHALRNLRRLAAPAATLAAAADDAPLREALTAAGFDCSSAPSHINVGHDGLASATVARFAPRHLAPPPPGRCATAGRSAVVVGAGLAGASAALALARLGIDTLVLDRHALPAQETSGNAGGLFHGVVHGADAVHSRWLRAAALRAHRVYAPLVQAGLVAGQTQGLLRGAQATTLQAMGDMLDAQCLPSQWAQALSADEAQARSGIAWPGPAWLMGRAGWVSPAGLVAHWLQTEGVHWRGGVQVDRLQVCAAGWRLLDDAGRPLAEAPIVVLANALDLPRLLGHAPGDWQRQRGQVSMAGSGKHELPLPVADGGYALTLSPGLLLFGASSQWDDTDDRVRPEDHALNLAVLRRLTGWDLSGLPSQGRVGWRMQTEDRMPWVGAAPAPQGAAGPRRDQPRFAPRLPGLYVLAGLGSRGLTHAPLAGELLAHWITGAPMPVPSRLIDAVDPARHAARAARTAQQAEPGLNRS